ncbi:MAG TPA: phage baseplate assembly protein V [Denitromonas sp.]|nr:phage baseplate assembly protein V [Denitromonas sp.]
MCRALPDRCASRDPRYLDRHAHCTSRRDQAGRYVVGKHVCITNEHRTGAGCRACVEERLGRVKIRFHWQQGHSPDDRSSCWVRVVTRQAGAGMGWQALPRIGQEVLVTFLGYDFDRPLVLGALYNGRGEGGIVPTPRRRRGHAR